MKKEGFDFEFKDDQSFWVPVQSMNTETKQMEQNGFVRIQLEIVPKDYAEDNKVGAAREEPNANPFLPPPVGRVFFSLNPCVMYKQLVGPAMRRKICIYCCTITCCVLCIALFLYMIPTIIANKISSWI